MQSWARRILLLAILLLLPGAGALSLCSPTRLTNLTPFGKGSAAVARPAMTPLIFEENVGQSRSGSRYLARGKGYAFHLSPHETRLALTAPPTPGGTRGGKKTGAARPASSGATVTARLVGANPKASPRGENRLKARINYFVGNDRSRWVTDVPAYEKVRTAAVYPGIDLVHYGREDGALEYDFEVAPGADPSLIQFRVEGAERVSVAGNGDLVLQTPSGEIRQQKPICYQETFTGRLPVEGSFRLNGQAAESPTVSFELAEYDPSQPLTIDPVLVYSTYFLGTSQLLESAITTDENGYAYVAGSTGSIDFPTTAGPFEHQGPTVVGGDAYVSVFDPTKSGVDSLVYSTYLSGNNIDVASCIDLDSRGRIVVSGRTQSKETFPATDSLYTTYLTEDQGWLAVLDPAQSGAAGLAYSTIIDILGLKIAVGPSDQIYFCGTAYGPVLPITANAFQRNIGGTTDGGFGVLNTNRNRGQAIVYCTYLGARFFDGFNGIDVDARGQAYLIGWYDSNGLPVTQGCFQPASLSEDGSGMMLVVMNPFVGTQLVYATYFGSSAAAAAIKVDSRGRACFVGSTGPELPVTSTLWRPYENDGDGFYAVVDPSKQGPSALVYSTYIPLIEDDGNPATQEGERAIDLAIDDAGRAYVIGASRDNYLAVFDPSESGEASLETLDYQPFDVAAVAVGPSNRVYLTGFAGPTEVPTTPSRYRGPLGLDSAIVMVMEKPEPTEPGSLLATPLSSTQIKLTWIDRATDETEFRIERRRESGGFSEIATLGPNKTSYTDSGLAPGTTYSYRMRCRAGGFLSRYSLTATARTPETLLAPVNLTATTVTSTRIDLAWQDLNSDENEVRIERKSGGGAFVRIAASHAGVGSFINNGLTPNTTYTYRVQAVRGLELSPYSNSASATTLPVPPAPTGLKATAVSSSRIELAWTATIPEAEIATSRFEVERKNADGTFSKLANVAATLRTYGDPGLTPEKQYTYRVRTVNAVGNSAYSSEASATTKKEDIPPPTNLEGNAPGQLTVALFWEDKSANENGFKLERSLNGTVYVEVKTLAADTVEARDTGLQANTKYWYRIRAYRDEERSAYSNVVAVTTLPLPPVAPTGLTAQPSADGTARLKWTDKSDNETRFRVEMQLGDTGYREVASAAANTDTWTSGKLLSNQAYSFRVRAQNTGGFSAYSNAASALMFPVSMKSLTVTTPAAPAGRSRLDLKWTDPNGVPVKAKLVRSKGGTVEKEVVVGAGILTYADTALLPSTTYQYTLTAFNATGEAAAVSASGSTLAPPPPPPAAPDGLTCVIAGPNSAELKWRDRSSDEDGFKIERATGAGAFAQVAVVAANAVAWTDSRLAPATAYRFRLRAYRGSDHSEYSGEAGGTTPTLPPAAPGGLTAKAVAVEKVDLTWTDRSNNEITFHVERAVGESAFAEIGTTGAGKTAFTDENIDPATTYRYRVRAKNEGGFSAYSNTASITIERLLRGTLEVTGELNFGGVKVGKRKALTLTLRNASATERLALTIGAIGKPFKVDSGGGKVVLEPGQSRAVVVSFAPKKPKKYTGQLSVQSSDPKKLNSVIAAKGTGK